jgi:hypothetical protein
MKCETCDQSLPEPVGRNPDWLMGALAALLYGVMFITLPTQTLIFGHPHVMACLIMECIGIALIGLATWLFLRSRNR